MIYGGRKCIHDLLPLKTFTLDLSGLKGLTWSHSFHGFRTWEWLRWMVLAQGLSWAGAAVIRRLDWGYRIHFQDGSLMMSLSGGLSFSCVSVSLKLLSVLMTWLGASPRVRNLSGGGRTPFMTCPQKSHAVTSAALHPFCQPFLMKLW